MEELPMNCEVGWLAIQVKSRHELLTAKILSNKGYDPFVPLYRSKRQWSDRRKEVELPLFAGYIFSKFKAGAWGPIITTPGVIRIVCAGKTMAVISDSEIEVIRTVVQHGFKAQPCGYLKNGDRVRIEDGPLAGVEGILVGWENGHRLILSIDLVQSSVAVDINSCKLQRVGLAIRSACTNSTAYASHMKLA